MSKLKTIDQAPHDGTTLLLYSKAWESEEPSFGFRIGHFECEGEVWNEGCWVMSGGYVSGEGETNPTHFARLPSVKGQHERAKV